MYKNLWFLFFFLIFGIYCSLLGADALDHRNAALASYIISNIDFAVKPPDDLALKKVICIFIVFSLWYWNVIADSFSDI